MPGSDRRALVADIAVQRGEKIHGKPQLSSPEPATLVFLRHKTFSENEDNVAEQRKHALVN